MAEMVRVNTRISKTLNEWLDEQTEETGVSKSTQIMLALENYRREKEVMGRMGEMEKLLQKLQEFSGEKES
ncbi:hypothetical protein [Priestia koreensis]|uniref:hypothetical protein n=1 Tax=Priestia koreensis TaxID=284581 RepID=UPI0030173352